ncbi:MAG: CoA transferase [Dehalococcoidia bacterium]|nr:CoA transferase [Dehalococcoidia bacterium]
MTRQPELDMPLGPYRVLDLTQGGCLIGPRILGDLGADVIKIERPGGDPSRSLGPFYRDTIDPQKSLFWFAYCANKRGITLDIETADGKELFMALAKAADFVVESFPVGYLADLGLGYDALSRTNPRIVMTSITPFGQEGPKSRYKGCDLTEWATAGCLYTMGAPDHAPTWITFGAQSSLHAGAEAAAGSLIAHWHREQTGEGQHVDVSAQKSLAWLNQATIQMWEVNRYIYHRAGAMWVTGHGVARRQCYACKDGFVAFTVFGGGLVNLVMATRAMVAWMAEEGVAPDWLKTFNWVDGFDTSRLTQETVDRVEAPFAHFFMDRTKAELWEQSLKRGIVLAPVNTLGDVAADPHLQARRFWEQVPHPELGEELTYCGAFYKFSETPLRIRRRAPLIGEHNQEIYERELGISREKLVLLKQAGAI